MIDPSRTETRIPATPQEVAELDLMKLLQEYGAGQATWRDGPEALSPELQASCQRLHADIVSVYDQVAPILDRVTARELDSFTMHDRQHALKVAHLMWHLLTAQRRAILNPPEIGLLVLSAVVHDLGMFISAEARETRLAPESDMWEHLGVSPETLSELSRLEAESSDESISAESRIRAARLHAQALEALLCQDARERHATRARYLEMFSSVSEAADVVPLSLHQLESCFTFQGDSFKEKLIDVCVSHAEDAESLVRADPRDPAYLRFPRAYPVGSETIDLMMVASALRLADILDFDRERTPAVLFHYLMPRPHDPQTSRSVLEWEKHLSVSNWRVGEDTIEFHGHCHNHIVHHAIVGFCEAIEYEISSTRAVFESDHVVPWPFVVPSKVTPRIEQHGYRYVPYRFQLDDARIYELLMGGALYESPLVALRELIQNAVDACSLRDRMVQLYQPELDPRTDGRIIVRFEEAADQTGPAVLTIQDSGTGMDELILTRFFLQVGRSYYRSPEFSKTRASLLKGGLDFAPVSDFGIGFLSCFLLSDSVVVETAMGESPRGDSRRRTLIIDGPTRLIRLEEDPNVGPDRFRGTRVTLRLASSLTDRKHTIGWSQIRSYLTSVCRSLPYPLTLQRVVEGKTEEEVLNPMPVAITLPEEVRDHSVLIPVVDAEIGIRGQIAITRASVHRRYYKAAAAANPIVESGEDVRWAGRRRDGIMTRGGFVVGSVPGIPISWSGAVEAVIELSWEGRTDRRFATTDVARTRVAQSEQLAEAIAAIWFDYLITKVDELPQGLILGLAGGLGNASKYNPQQLYRLALNGWRPFLAKQDVNEAALHRWEGGEGPSLPLVDLSDLTTGLLLMALGSRTILRVHVPGTVWLSLCPPKDGLIGLDTEQVSMELPHFVEFEGVSPRTLHIDQTHASQFLNIAYRERVHSLFGSDVPRLPRLLAEMRSARTLGWPMALSDQDAQIVRRLVEELGELELFYVTEGSRLDTFLPR